MQARDNSSVSHGLSGPDEQLTHVAMSIGWKLCLYVYTLGAKKLNAFEKSFFGEKNYASENTGENKTKSCT